MSGIAAAAGFADLLAAFGLGGGGAVTAPVDGQTAAAPRRAAARLAAADAEVEPLPADANPAQTLALGAPPALMTALPSQAVPTMGGAKAAAADQAQAAPALAGEPAPMPAGALAAPTFQIPARTEDAMSAQTSAQPPRSAMAEIADPLLAAAPNGGRGPGTMPEATPIAPAPTPAAVIDLDGPTTDPARMEGVAAQFAQASSSERARPSARSSAASPPAGAAAAGPPVSSVQAAASAGTAATVAARAAKSAAAVKELAAAIPAAPPVDPATPAMGGDPSLAAAAADSEGLSTAAPAAGGSPAAPAVPTPPAAQIAVQITRHAAAGERMVISLSPKELGGVEIEIELDGEGHARAHIAAELPGTLELIQRDAPLLEKALEAAGLDLAPDALTFDLRRDGQPSQQQQYREPRPTSPGLPMAGVPGDAPQLPVRPPGQASRLLDLSV